MSLPLWYRTLKLVPKNAFSKAAGVYASMQLPKPIVKRQIHAFAKRFGVNAQESARPIEDFESLQAFFTRPLKAGARPIDAAKNSIVSPCDGAFGQSGAIENGTLLQIKGKPYSLQALLGDAQWASIFEGGSYATFYLSPKDYHRFHVPMDAYVLEAIHIPGHLWPVHTRAVETIDRLFCVNERVVMFFAPKDRPQERMAMVAVGATVVGKVKVEFDKSLTTNTGTKEPERRFYEQRPFFDKGVEIGRFEMGSTVVLLASKALGALDSKAQGTPVRLGEKIGHSF